MNYDPNDAMTLTIAEANEALMQRAMEHEIGPYIIAYFAHMVGITVHQFLDEVDPYSFKLDNDTGHLIFTPEGFAKHNHSDLTYEGYVFLGK